MPVQGLSGMTSRCLVMTRGLPPLAMLLPLPLPLNYPLPLTESEGQPRLCEGYKGAQGYEGYAAGYPLSNAHQMG